MTRKKLLPARNAPDALSSRLRSRNQYGANQLLTSTRTHVIGTNCMSLLAEVARLVQLLVPNPPAYLQSAAERLLPSQLLPSE